MLLRDHRADFSVVRSKGGHVKTYICRQSKNYSLAVEAETHEEAENKAAETPLEQWDCETVTEAAEEEGEGRAYPDTPSEIRGAF